MDVMRPKLTRIGNMCFRRLDLPSDEMITNYSEDKTNDSKVNTFENKTNSYLINNNDSNSDNKESVIDETNEKKCIDELEAMDSEEEGIKEISGQNGKRFRIELKISKRYHGLVLGKHGLTKKRLENDTNTRIEVPNMTDLRSAVRITGDSKSAVKSAKLRINSIIDSMRLKSDFTHFVSIPFNYNSIQEQFNQFKKEVLNDNSCKSKGIDESLFQSSNKLHLTIAPLLLCDENERSIASQTLEECNRNFIKSITNGKPILVRVQGIDYMNDDPTQVDVVYAKIVDLTENQCLQTIINEIFTRYEESKLMTRSHEFDRVSDNCKVKPHLTLLNSKFRQRFSKSVRDDRNPKRETFDATPIINSFGNYLFGEIAIETIDISIRHSNGRGKDGYYSHTYSITL